MFIICIVTFRYVNWFVDFDNPDHYAPDNAHRIYHSTRLPEIRPSYQSNISYCLTYGR